MILNIYINKNPGLSFWQSLHNLSYRYEKFICQWWSKHGQLQIQAEITLYENPSLPGTIPRTNQVMCSVINSHQQE